MSKEHNVIGLVMLGGILYVGVCWLAMRILMRCSNEIQTDFDYLKTKERE